MSYLADTSHLARLPTTELSYDDAELAERIGRHFAHVRDTTGPFAPCGGEHYQIALGTLAYPDRPEDLDALKDFVYRAVAFGGAADADIEQTLYWRVRPEISFHPGIKAPYVDPFTGGTIAEDFPAQWKCYARLFISNGKPVEPK